MLNARMSDQDQQNVAGLQHDVQRLLGRCVLRLQEYERLLKHMVALQQISGTPETLLDVMAARHAESSGRTLGILINRLMSDYIRPEGKEFPNQPLGPHNGSAYFRTQMYLDISQEDYHALEVVLKGLVKLRNDLVHHFIEHHEIGTVDGCLRARDALCGAGEQIEGHFKQLVTFAHYQDQARRMAAEAIQSPEFMEMIINGIAPDGQIHWPMAGIVEALKRAARELSTDGWASVDEAARWVAAHHPEQTPSKYGCSRWRHVIHESGQFEQRRLIRNGQSGMWFRERPNRELTGQRRNRQRSQKG